jgi:hypothetical protein
MDGRTPWANLTHGIVRPKAKAIGGLSAPSEFDAAPKRRRHRQSSHRVIAPGEPAAWELC